MLAETDLGGLHILESNALSGVLWIFSNRSLYSSKQFANHKLGGTQKATQNQATLRKTTNKDVRKHRAEEAVNQNCHLSQSPEFVLVMLNSVNSLFSFSLCFR